jgi:hypothetical protein
MTSEQGTSSLLIRVLDAMDRAHGIARHTLQLGVQWSFAIAHSRYENIDLQTMSQGFTPGYDDAELDRVEEEEVLLACDLVASMEMRLSPS